MNTVQFKQDVVDYGDAHSFFITGYRSISRISAGIIRETFYEEREMGGRHDRATRRAACAVGRRTVARSAPGGRSDARPEAHPTGARGPLTGWG